MCRDSVVDIKTHGVFVCVCVCVWILGLAWILIGYRMDVAWILLGSSLDHACVLVIFMFGSCLDPAWVLI